MDAGWPPASDAAVRRGARGAETRTTKWPGTLPATEGAAGPKNAAALISSAGAPRCVADRILHWLVPRQVRSLLAAVPIPRQVNSIPMYSLLLMQVMLLLRMDTQCNCTELTAPGSNWKPVSHLIAPVASLQCTTIVLLCSVLRLQ